MRNILLIFLISFFCIDYSDAQIEFQGIMYNDYSPGVEIGLELKNTSGVEINQIQIQIRRTLPTSTPSLGGIYVFDPALQPGSSQWVYPFEHCVDAEVDFGSEFEVKIYAIDGQIVQIIQVLDQIFVEVSGCELLSNAGPFQMFCAECGDPSGIFGVPHEVYADLRINVYNSVGEMVIRDGKREDLGRLSKGELYILYVYTKNGYEIHKITIN